MTKARMHRVDTAVQEVVSDAIGALKDPRVGFVTVTGVDTSPDLRHAKVFVSVLGSATKQEMTVAGLDSAHGFLQGQVAKQLRLKNTPTLEFILDTTAEHAARIERLLKEAQTESDTE